MGISKNGSEVNINETNLTYHPFLEFENIILNM
jgi:hypothetical protein